MDDIDNTILHTSVFADGPGGGNPCPVVLDADNLTTEQGMALVANFGAETILVVKPNNPDADFGLRYFVPRHEMEMCVHGTIAAATVLWKNGDIVRSPLKVSTALGNIELACEEQNGKLQVTVLQFSAQFSHSSPNVDELCSALRIPADAILKDQGPVISVSTSRHKLIVPLSSQMLLDQLDPDFEALWDICDQYETTGFYPSAPVSSGEPDVYAARQFPNRAGYNEDPATGVAACALGAYLATYRNCEEGWRHFQILQGYAIRRPSRLNVGACVKNGSVVQTCVSGTAEISDKPFQRL